MLKVHQKVEVTVTDIDINRKRIALSMKDNESKPVEIERREPAKSPKPVQKPVVIKKPEVQPESDLQIKLAALKDKFR